jgi:uncharacterized OB-fold protein
MADAGAQERTSLPATGVVPIATPETDGYWSAAQAGELWIQQCSACRTFYLYPRPFCPFCASADVEWRAASGRGRLISYVINHRPLPPGPPQIVALVELEEGPRMLTNIIGVEPLPERLALDAPVRVDFEHREGCAIPIFRLEDPQ